MTFLDLQNQVTSMSVVQSQTTLVQFACQWALNRISQEFEIPYYLNSKGSITTTAPYSTGKATCTNGSQSVTGSGTTWTSAMVGLKIQLQGDNAHYYISAVNSTTSLTLAVPYQGVNGTNVTYNIYQDEYLMASDIQSYNTFVQIQNSVPMVDIPTSRFDQNFPTQQSFDSPYLTMMEGTQINNIYSTGTVSVTVNTISPSTVTGVGTNWLSVTGLGRMTNIIINGVRYTVQSVVSNTSLLVYELIAGTVSGSSYQILLRNYTCQVYPIPADVESLYYRFYRMPDIMVNSYDVPDLPNDFHDVIVWGALSWIYLQKGDSQKAYNTAESNFQQRMKIMKSRIGNPSADRIYCKQSQDRQVRRLDGLEKGTFDRRWSGW